MNKYLLGLVNTLVPGFGAALLGHFTLALLTQCLLVITLISLCQLQLFDSRSGFLLAAGLIACIHLLSTLGLRTVKAKSIGGGKKTLTCLFFIIGTAAMLLGLVQFNDRLLGYALYFVPSESMQPTLEPADLILVNSRDQAHWSLGRVVVFRSADRSDYFYVKRVAAKPEHLRNSADNLYFVLGDNRDHSADSRVLGLIQQEYIRGEVKLVLLNLAKPGRKLLALP